MFSRVYRFVPLAVVLSCFGPVYAQLGGKSTFKAVKPGPSQASLAHKGAFSAVPASDASVKAALAATNLEKAKGKLNKTATFMGTVTSVYAPKSGQRVLLDFAPNFKSAVIGLIDEANFKTFPDLKQLKGKKVLVSGKVVSYKEQTQVELTSPTSIKIIK